MTGVFLVAFDYRALTDTWVLRLGGGKEQVLLIFFEVVMLLILKELYTCRTLIQMKFIY